MESPANTTLRQGMLMPYASVLVAITTLRCLALKRISTAWRYFLGRPLWWTPMPRCSALSRMSWSSSRRDLRSWSSSCFTICSPSLTKVNHLCVGPSSSTITTSSWASISSSLPFFLSRAFFASFAAFSSAASFASRSLACSSLYLSSIASRRFTVSASSSMHMKRSKLNTMHGRRSLAPRDTRRSRNDAATAAPSPYSMLL
mmetsp:Transcript_24448/g.83589  ORF Transcript_24448/g.83589 Transcript_24448/m.83589 type:complete len:202 (-) Transcript_24448:1305-1910(-)